MYIYIIRVNFGLRNTKECSMYIVVYIVYSIYEVPFSSKLLNIRETDQHHLSGENPLLTCAYSNKITYSIFCWNIFCVEESSRRPFFNFHIKEFYFVRFHPPLSVPRNICCI